MGANMDNKRNESLASLANYFAENTSMHGLSRWIGKPGFVRRSFWVLAVLTGAGIAYSKWKVSTVVSLEYKSELRFPAVTFCNLNPVKKTSIDNQTEFDGMRTALRYQNDSAPTEDEDFPDWENSSESFDAYDSDYQTMVDFQKALAVMKTPLQVRIGHQIQDMLVECSFQGKVCKPSNFTHFYNYRHGNCYTFAPTDDDYAYISKTGPIYGLALTLYAEEQEYISSLSSSVGFKVVVHNHNTMPFPEDEGFDISPGFATSASISKVSVERVSEPYGNCKAYGPGVEEPANIFTTQVPNITYSDQTCKKTCVQKMLVSQCGCCDNMYPCNRDALRILNSSINYDVGFCILHEETNACESAVWKKLENNQMFCPDSCDPNCKDESHRLEISTAMWPASSHLPSLVHGFINRFKKKMKTPPINMNDSADEKDTFFRRNVMQLNVFYKELKYQKIQTKPAYDWKSLLSDVGGQAGLWLGFSLLTLAEILELIVDMVFHLCTKPFRSNKRHVNPVEKKDEIHF